MRNRMNLTSNAKLEIVGDEKTNVAKPINSETMLPEIVTITTYPPRECGIATYSQDLIAALRSMFGNSFEISICSLESNNERHQYSEKVKYTLNTDDSSDFEKLAAEINSNATIQTILIQHEFGLFKSNETVFIQFLKELTKPVIMAFHTVLPNPNHDLHKQVKELAALSDSIIVMTQSSAELLSAEYGISPNKIIVIAHGTHLIAPVDKTELKEKYDVFGKKILSTFGLLSSGKSIETTLAALPAIKVNNPDVLFLIIGKTHPTVLKQDGEYYRDSLERLVSELKLENNVRFINQFLPLNELLEYLQLTDIYLFTSKDPNQSVSGTFSYASSCGCAIVCTPIPHANELLKNNAGLRVNFENPKELGEAVIRLLNDDGLRKSISSNGLHQMASTAWENSAIAHAKLFQKNGNHSMNLNYNLPEINLNHLKKLTTPFGIIQFSKLNQPDIESGYTLDDNARALIAICQHYELTNNEEDLEYATTYFGFIKHCLNSDGYFLNYVDEQQKFTKQNNTTNLADANGRAIWALGYFISIGDLFPEELIFEAENLLQKVLLNVNRIHSTRAMAFIIKGVYYKTLKSKTLRDIELIDELAKRLVQMYKHEADENWKWYESYLTYANSILSEALLCAWLATGELIYREIAKSSFDFLLTLIFTKNNIQVISNKNWMHKGTSATPLSSDVEKGGQQPIDVAYTILALSKFQDVFKDEGYLNKMELGFNWFLGNNHLHQIIYNPRTGGCYDGLEKNNVNLNQGAESTISYLLARLAVEKSLQNINSYTKQFDEAKEHLLKLK